MMDRIVTAQVFVTIVERGSLAAAARTLGMSRAMVTRHLAQMEVWARARLLHRTTRRLGLTPAGESVLTWSRQLLDTAESIPTAELVANATPQGTLRIASSQFLAQHVLGAAVTEFLQRHPQTSVDLMVEGRAVNLVEERIDLAVRAAQVLDPNLIARPLGYCESVVCAAPAYLRRHGTPRRPSDLNTHNCLTYAYLGRREWGFTEARSGAPVSVQISGNFTANDSMTLLSAVREGAGIAVQPLSAALPWLASGELVSLLPGYIPQSVGVYGVYLSRQHMSLALRAMLDFLVEWFEARQNLPGGLSGTARAPSELRVADPESLSDRSILV
jgi:DNA-binding transcriptional LysR family regulator